MHKTTIAGPALFDLSRMIVIGDSTNSHVFNNVYIRVNVVYYIRQASLIDKSWKMRTLHFLPFLYQAAKKRGRV